MKLPSLFREESKEEKKKGLGFRDRMELVKEKFMALIDGKARELQDRFDEIDKQIEEERRRKKEE